MGATSSPPMALTGRARSDPSAGAKEARVPSVELKREGRIGERSVPELPEALQGDGARLTLTSVTVLLLGKGFWTLLIEEDETSGESGGTQQAD